MTINELQKIFADATEETWHQHPNGNGWVQNTASVADTAYVGPNALVYENACVAGFAQVFGNAWIFGNAQVLNVHIGFTWVFNGFYFINDNSRITKEIS